MKLYWRVKRNGKWTWTPACLVYDHLRTGVRIDGKPSGVKPDGIYRVAPLEEHE